MRRTTELVSRVRHSARSSSMMHILYLPVNKNPRCNYVAKKNKTIKKRNKNKLMKLNCLHGLHLLSTANTHSQHSSPTPLTIAEKNKPFLFETNRLFFVRSLPQLLSCFFCSVQLSNLISRNFHYDAMQQYR